MESREALRGWYVVNVQLTPAFLLNNGYEYHVAHGFGLIEYFVSSYFWPNKFNTVASSLPALAICKTSLSTNP